MDIELKKQGACAFVYFQKSTNGTVVESCVNNALQGPFMTECNRNLTSIVPKRADNNYGVHGWNFLSIRAVLRCFCLDMENITIWKNSHNTTSVGATDDTKAFIVECLNGHCFSIRKVEEQWIELDSQTGSPKLECRIDDLLCHIQCLGGAVYAVSKEFPNAPKRRFPPHVAMIPLSNVVQPTIITRPRDLPEEEQKVSQTKRKREGDSNIVEVKDIPLEEKMNIVSDLKECEMVQWIGDPKRWIGKQVEVLWSLDDKWYRGTIMNYSEKSNNYQIAYEDGEFEWLDLSKETFNFVEGRKLAYQTIVKGQEPVNSKKSLLTTGANYKSSDMSIRMTLVLENDNPHHWTLDYGAGYVPNEGQLTYLKTIGAEFPYGNQFCVLPLVVELDPGFVAGARHRMKPYADPSTWDKAMRGAGHRGFSAAHIAQNPKKGDIVRVCKTSPGWENGIVTGNFDEKASKVQVLFADRGELVWIDPHSKDVKLDVLGMKRRKEEIPDLWSYDELPASSFPTPKRLKCSPSHPPSRHTRKLEVDPSSFIKPEPEPKIAISSQPTIAISSQPKIAISSQPKIAISSQPKIAISSQPKIAISSQPKITISSKPKIDISSQPKIAISSEPKIDISSEPMADISSEPMADISSEPNIDISSKPKLDISTEPPPPDPDPPALPTRVQKPVKIPTPNSSSLKTTKEPKLKPKKRQRHDKAPSSKPSTTKLAEVSKSSSSNGPTQQATTLMDVDENSSDSNTSESSAVDAETQDVSVNPDKEELQEKPKKDELLEKQGDDNSNGKTENLSVQKDEEGTGAPPTLTKVPTNVEEFIEQMGHLNQSVRLSNFNNFCRYCGARASNGWMKGPWGERTMCRSHGALYLRKRLVFTNSDIEETPKSPEDVPYPEENTETKFYLNSFKKASNRALQSQDQPEYAVEEVVDSKYEKGVEYFLVKWEGYDASYNSWEPMASLSKCVKLIKAFRKKRNLENRDNPVVL